MVREVNICIKEFEKFYEQLMKNAPKDYIPWFFPCEPNGKNPSPEAILNMDSTSKGSWHHQSARLNKSQCLWHINQGYNIGLSARTGDPLIIIDIDNKLFLNQLPKDTLTATSRKRIGAHAFCWNKDGTAKINLPTDDGEIRSDNQYVLACGSYVSFNIEEKKDLEAFNELTDEEKNDKLLGYYTLKDENSPRAIAFNEVPQFFQDKQKENLDAESKIKQRDELKEYQKHRGGKYDELFNLKMSDIISIAKKREGHPLHESDTDANFSMSKDGSICHCWRHLVSLNAVQYLCVQSGYSSCVDAGTPHKGRGISKIKGDKNALEAAYNEAVKCGLIKNKEEIVPKKEEPTSIKTMNEQEIEEGRGILNFMYYELISILKNYLVMEEQQYKIIALWILGTYAHEYFNTYPLLFFNAMRGSGKTRTLRLISALGAGGDGSVQNNLTEAVLFRIPRGKTTCIDEVEQIGNKEKSTLRELLNAAYKKGMKVCRMKKTKKKNEMGVLEEVHVAEEFEPYFPIALANINGLDEVLADRAITLTLEKSDNPEKTKKNEDFDKNIQIQWIKQSLCRFGVVVQLVLSKKVYENWNFWLKSKYNYTTYTTYIHNTNNINYTKNPHIMEYLKATSNQNVVIDSDTEKFFEKLDGANIVGRNFELFSPLLILANFIEPMLFDDILEIVKVMVNEKKSVEFESKDVSLYEFVLLQENLLNGEFISIKEITRQFRSFTNEDESEDRWLNEKWMGKALKRLNLILDKRRMKFGMEVRLNYLKAREKLKIFKF